MNSGTRTHDLDEGLLRSMFGAPTSVVRGPSVARGPSLVIFDRIHGAFAEAEQRLLHTRHETAPIPNRDDLMHGLLPQTEAPIDFTCTICMEKITKGAPQQLLNCGHKFCASCFCTWAQQQGNSTTCPMCRTPVTSSALSRRSRDFMGSNSPVTSSVFSRRSRDFTGSNTMTPQQQSMAFLMRVRAHH
jgi:hypothetical protein